MPADGQPESRGRGRGLGSAAQHLHEHPGGRAAAASASEGSQGHGGLGALAALCGRCGGGPREPGQPRRNGRNNTLKIFSRWLLKQLRSARWEPGREKFRLTFPAPRCGQESCEEEVLGFSIADPRGGDYYMWQLLDIRPSSTSVLTPVREGPPPRRTNGGVEKLQARRRSSGLRHPPEGVGSGHGGTPPVPQSPGGGGVALKRVIADLRRSLLRMDAGGAAGGVVRTR